MIKKDNTPAYCNVSKEVTTPAGSEIKGIKTGRYGYSVIKCISAPSSPWLVRADSGSIIEINGVLYRFN